MFRSAVVIFRQYYGIEECHMCMDGTPPAYHLHPGSGSGNRSWIVNLEGGGWCNNARACQFRKSSRRGSSDLMDKEIPFGGIMSSSPVDNPDFYNWNRVKIRYCDGASFAGEGFDKARAAGNTHAADDRASCSC
ncbi:hypothetical protein U9M48_019944 [Paspalum notatum var. saurae]|uniref:Pectin acetylesterase n=1 Tax=Paspalum notatum var. saurae TaxID=547442 RepID=A0AAQ3WS02_PASNO